MNKLFKWLLYFTGNTVIPKEVIQREEKIILHITDTPYVINKALDKLIKAIKPEYLVHTGDLVDDIKLELHPGQEDEYMSKVRKLLGIMQSESVGQAYVVLGNHDSEKVMTVQSEIDSALVNEKDKHKGKLQITGKTMLWDIEGVKIEAGHRFSELSEETADFKLFGHNIIPDSKYENGCCYLNGIEAISVIFLESKNLVRFKYPIGTNDYRQKKRKLGM